MKQIMDKLTELITLKDLLRVLQFSMMTPLGKLSRIQPFELGFKNVFEQKKLADTSYPLRVNMFL